LDSIHHIRRSVLDLEQLKRLRDLNVELLETIICTFSFIKEWCEKNKLPPLPTEDKFGFLLKRAINLIEEINEEIALPPKWKHRFRTPEDSTEPCGRG